MKQIIQNYKTGKVTLEEVPVPLCGRKSILVRNCHSLISIGTEKATIELGKKSLLGKARARPDLVKRVIEKAKNEGILKTFSEAMGRLDTPTPLGYSAAGIVVEAGIEAHGFAPGDRVACIGQGFASHADVISVPMQLAVKLPDDVSTEEAAFGMLGCIALHGIRSADLTFGSTVAVIGLGLLGQLTVQLLKAYGCAVLATDLSLEKTMLAKKSGADFAENNAMLFKNTAHNVDAVIIAAATNSNEPVDLAIELCRPKGKIVIVGVTDIHPDRNALWKKEIELIVSKAAGPGSLDDQYEKMGIDYPLEIARWTENRNLKEFIRLISKKLLNLKLLISGKYAIDEAEIVYNNFLNNKLNNPIGLLFEYQHVSDMKRKLILHQNANHLANHLNKINVSVIGAGLYGKTVFLPILKKQKNIYLKTLITSSGFKCKHSGKKFGFESCATDASTIFNEQDTQAIIALTPHSQHADLILQCIESNKNLLIEKPLCIHKDELTQIIDCYNNAANKPIMMIGHNRRFSPHTQKMREWLKNRINPAVLLLRINAGFVPKEHWVHSNTEGRSRIVGEMTHFVDLMQYLLNEKPISVVAERITGNNQAIINNDNISVIIKFERGSIGTLVYTAAGNRAFNREMLELFFDEKTIISTDFRRSALISHQSKKYKTSSQSIGYHEEIEYFINAVREKNNLSDLLKESFIAMQTVFAIEKS